MADRITLWRIVLKGLVARSSTHPSQLEHVLDQKGMSVGQVRYLGRDGARGAGLALIMRCYIGQGVPMVATTSYATKAKTAKSVGFGRDSGI